MSYLYKQKSTKHTPSTSSTPSLLDASDTSARGLKNGNGDSNEGSNDNVGQAVATPTRNNIKDKAMRTESEATGAAGADSSRAERSARSPHVMSLTPAPAPAHSLSSNFDVEDDDKEEATLQQEVYLHGHQCNDRHRTDENISRSVGRTDQQQMQVLEARLDACPPSKMAMISSSASRSDSSFAVEDGEGGIDLVEETGGKGNYHNHVKGQQESTSAPPPETPPRLTATPRRAPTQPRPSATQSTPIHVQMTSSSPPTRQRNVITSIVIRDGDDGDELSSIASSTTTVTTQRSTTGNPNIPASLEPTTLATMMLREFNQQQNNSSNNFTSHHVGPDDGNETYTTMENTTSIPPSSPPRHIRKEKYYPKFKATATAQRAIIFDIENEEYNNFNNNGGAAPGRSATNFSTDIVCFGKRGAIIFILTVILLIIIIIVTQMR